MLRYLLARLVTFLPTFIGVTLISFSFIRVLPGDPIIVMAGERGLSEERYNELVQQFGFDKPVIVQYWDYLTGVVQGPGDAGAVHLRHDHRRDPGIARGRDSRRQSRKAVR